MILSPRVDADAFSTLCRGRRGQEPSAPVQTDCGGLRARGSGSGLRGGDAALISSLARARLESGVVREEPHCLCEGRGVGVIARSAEPAQGGPECPPVPPRGPHGPSASIPHGLTSGMTRSGGKNATSGLGSGRKASDGGSGFLGSAGTLRRPRQMVF